MSCTGPPLSDGRHSHNTPLASSPIHSHPRKCAITLGNTSPCQTGCGTMCMRIGPKVCWGDHECDPRRGQRRTSSVRCMEFFSAHCPLFCLRTRASRWSSIQQLRRHSLAHAKVRQWTRPRWPEGEKGGGSAGEEMGIWETPRQLFS